MRESARHFWAVDPAPACAWEEFITKEGLAMTQNNGVRMLKHALLFSIIFNAFYGIGFFILPAVLRDMAGGTPVELGWIRWSGGVLLALSAGGLQAYRNPERQIPMITTLTLAPLLSSLALLYTLTFEAYSIRTWFIALPCAMAFVLFVVMFLARQGSKAVLE